MDRSRSTVAAAAVGAVTVLASVLIPGTASAEVPIWAQAGQATVHPGVQLDTEGGQCTANFVFHNDTDVFIGQAAHCAGTGSPTETSGCTSSSKPLGTPVTIAGASKPGTLAYSSWITMVERGEQDSNACAFNDFALVKVDPADRDKVNPSVPIFGGPTGIATEPTAFGDLLVSYGNSSLRGGLTQLSPKTGISLGDQGDGWSHSCFTLTPGIPGDSGSGFMTGEGKALGVLSTLVLLPVAGSNEVGDLSRELNYLNAHGDLGTVSLALGTVPFQASLVPPVAVGG
ncbi:MAG: serine protease [Pseudonocardiaceae bacterium]